MYRYTLHDLIEQPGFDTGTQNGRGFWVDRTRPSSSGNSALCRTPYVE